MHRFTMIPDWFFKTCFRYEIHLILCLVLVGCSSMPKLDADESSVHLKGKMVVSTDYVKKVLRYRFEGNVENGSLKLWSIVGVTAIEFRIIDSQLYYSGKETPVPILYSEEMMKKHLGFDFPFDLGWHWIRGIPDPNRNFMVIDRSGRGEIAIFEQLGWTVSQELNRDFDTRLKDRAKKIRIAKGKTHVLVTVESSSQRRFKLIQ